jgi:phosphoserine phosphatase
MTTRRRLFKVGALCVAAVALLISGNQQLRLAWSPAMNFAATEEATAEDTIMLGGYQPFGLALGLAVGNTTSRSADPERDPLPSWNEGPTKEAIIEFVGAVTMEGGPDYVPAAERIGVFDNDGTLWTEMPGFVQFAFAVDRVKALLEEHPEWRTTQPFQAVLEDDHEALAAAGLQGLGELVAATHTGMTSEEFDGIAREWFATARHPRFDRPYTELAFQPMVELLGYLKANGFKTYIVSGGGIEFMRAIAQDVYNIPPEQVIGSSGRTRFELQDGVPVLVRLPELDFYADGGGKVAAIQKFIGRRPIAAFGNSDGDLPMLQWTAAGPGRRLMLLVDHTDAEREYAYRLHPTGLGHLEAALAEAQERGWLVADMKVDWKRVFAFE